MVFQTTSTLHNINLTKTELHHRESNLHQLDIGEALNFKEVYNMLVM